MSPSDLSKLIREEYAKKRGFLRLFSGGAPEISAALKYLDKCQAEGVEDLSKNLKAFLGLVTILYTSFCRHVGGAYAEEYGGIGATNRLFFSDPLLNGAGSFRGNGDKLFFISGFYEHSKSQQNKDLVLQDAITRNGSATANVLASVLKNDNLLGTALLGMKLADVTSIMAEFIPLRFLPRMDRQSYVASTPFVKEVLDWIQASQRPAKAMLFVMGFEPTRCASNGKYQLWDQHKLGNTAPAIDITPKFSEVLGSEHQQKFETFFASATNDQVKKLAAHLNNNVNSFANMDLDQVLQDHLTTAPVNA